MGVVLGKTLGEIFTQRHQLNRKDVRFFHRSNAPHASLTQRWQGWTYDEVIESASFLRDALQTAGVRQEDRIALWSGPRIETRLIELAVLGCHAWSVPLFPNANLSDVTYVLGHSEPSILFVENSIQARSLFQLDLSRWGFLKKIVVLDLDSDLRELEQQSPLFISLQDFQKQAQRYPVAEFKKKLLHAQPSNTVMLCYTPGCSGTPKGVLLSHDNWISSIEACVKASEGYLEPQQEVVLSCLPPATTLGRLESWLIYAMDWTQYYCEHPEKLMTNLMEVQPSVVFLPPRDLETLYRQVSGEIKNLSHLRQQTLKQVPSLLTSWVFPAIKKRTGGNLRYIVSSGSSVPPPIAQDFSHWGISFFEGYGLTETTGPIALNTPEHSQYGSVGKPMPGTEIKTDWDGEIFVRSRKNFVGYYKDTPATQNKRFKDGWLGTGDLGYFDSKGFLHIIARKKDFGVELQKLGIEPQKIEALAKLEPYIQELVVHTGETQAVVALITLKREEIIQYAALTHLFYSSYAELTQHRKIYELIQKSIESLNQKLAPRENIYRFIILPQEFSIERGELTPSFQPRRQMIEQHYSEELQHLHSATLD